VNVAEVVRAGGDESAASSAIDAAIVLYERQGNIVSAARAPSAGLLEIR
jgi:hypothetical protein